MKTFVALLRGINVAGHRMVAMADLRDLLSRLGFLEVRSLLQSGNLVFQARGGSAAKLERLLSDAARDRLGLDTDILVRTDDDLRRIVAANPFVEAAANDPGRLIVMFLRAAPERVAVKALRESIRGREVLEVVGREAYIIYPDGMGRSRLTGNLIEKTLGTRGTARNWNTVLKLQAMVEP